MVYLDKVTEDLKSLSVAKVLVDTCSWPPIQGAVF